MKVWKLRLKNIKCFKDITIPFEDTKGQLKDWTLIAGDNGQGKTTILRSLAMGLCDKESASSHILKLDGDFLRHDTKEGFIRVCLVDASKNYYTIETKIKLEGKSYSISQNACKEDCIDKENIKNDEDASNTFKEKVFAVAYGTGRSPDVGTVSYEEYATVDSTVTLFEYNYKLHAPELVIRRLKEKVGWKSLKKLLKDVLMLKKQDEVELDHKGMYFITEQWGRVPLGALSDGYQSLTSIIADFLQWNLLWNDIKQGFGLKDISGIFIIDEIEQHLHPRWQRSVIKILSDQFPNVQFIGTTHAPLCVLGLYDLNCASQLLKASYMNGSPSEIQAFDPKNDYRGYRVDQVLTSQIFDLSDTRSSSIEEKLEKYRILYLKEERQRNQKEKKEMKEIEQELKDCPVWENMKDRQMKDDLIKLLRSS